MSTPIPKEELEFSQKLVELAKEHGCSSITIDYRPPHIPEFWDNIKVTWTRGRHNEKARVCVQYEQHDYFEV